MMMEPRLRLCWYACIHIRILRKEAFAERRLLPVDSQSERAPGGGEASLRAGRRGAADVG